MSHPRSAVRPGFVHALALALVTLAAGACSDNAAGPVAPSGDDAAISAQSFAALGSSAVLAAALSYPSAKAAQEEAPVSLTSSDGEGLALVSLDARAVVEGPLAFTELHLAFQNPTDRTIEGRFSITLPPGATVSRLAMSSPAGWQEAEVVERQLARRAYEDSLHRRVDPALLEKEAGNEFRARVFPIAPRAPKEIIVSYSQELRAGQRYKLNLKGLPEVGRIHATALVGGARREFDQKQGTPGRDFEVDVPASTTGLRSDDVVLARVRPDLGTERAPLGDVVVLFDTSASRALGFSAEVARLGRTLGELGKTADPGAKLTIAAFDQAVEPVFEGTFAELLPKHLDALLARRPLGATDLAGAAAWLGSRRKGAAAPARAIFVTDAVATASGADAAVAAVKALRPAVERVDVLLVGGIRDEELAGKLARGALSRDGVVIDASLPPAEIAKHLAATTRSGITVAVEGAEWSWPTHVDGVQPGDELLVYALMKKGAARGAKLGVTLGGSIRQKQDVALADVEKPLLERAAATAEIARLTATLNDEKEAARRDDLKARIVRISTRFRVLSDFTGLLVLESDRDYDRYGIDRRALADVLTVTERGVDVMHRQDAVLLVREEHQPEEPMLKSKDRRPKGGKDFKASASSPAVGNDHKPAAPAKKVAEEVLKAGAADEAAASGAPTDPGAPASGESGPPVQQHVVLQEKEIRILDKAPASKRAPAHEPPRPRPSPSAVNGGGKFDLSDVGGAPAGAPPPPPPPAAPGPRAAGAPPAETTVTRNPTPVTVMSPPQPAAPPDMDRDGAPDLARSNESTAAHPKPNGPPPYTGRMADVMTLLESHEIEHALVSAVQWQAEDPGDVMALVALGEALEASNRPVLAGRAYGSILDLFPQRADMRRFAAERLERLSGVGDKLAADAYEKAAADRPDHLNGHRLYAFSLLRAGRTEAAFVELESALAITYPPGRFAGGVHVLTEDLGLVGAAWIREEPKRRPEIEQRLARRGAKLATAPSLRFVLYWETDGNDVDFHIHDAKGGHAFYSHPELESGGELYADVTTGYGPECFTIEGAPTAYPYNLQIHYYSRGPMGYGMGKLEIIEHDGNGRLRFEERPYVVMNDRAFVDLGDVAGPLGVAKVAR